MFRAPPVVIPLPLAFVPVVGQAFATQKVARLLGRRTLEIRGARKV
jgi:hypothetical protein